ncbi:anti-sigma factor [Shewanella acanthi]|uniref:anti-sigma factor n=1 Tax=Shewanella acanthi TaxID=2864212 RepID=UPI001C65887F|nr:anti-sigma factor [Shewanella acanthi]QYJ79477.1 anti-sigma factor [Shewanella acanthi]
MTQTPRSSDAQLQQLISKMPKDIAPSQDLWQQIEQRMDRSPLKQATQASRTKVWSQWAIAAGVIIALSLGIKSLNNNDISNVITAMSDNPQLNQVSDDNQALQQLLVQIAQTHEAQLKNLQQTPNALVWQTTRLGAPLEQGIEELKRAGEQIYRALQANPTDKQLWQLWLWVQQREIDLLQQGQSLSIKNPTQGNSL